MKRFLIKTADDMLTGLDNGARWLRDELGVFGLLCLGVTLVALAMLLEHI